MTTTVGVGILSIATQIAFLPWVIATVGIRTYAVWIPLFAIVQWVNFADFGLDTAITTRAAGTIGNQQVVEFSSVYRFSVRMYGLVGIAESACVFLIGLEIRHTSPTEVALAGLAALFGAGLPTILRPHLLVLQAMNRYDLERLSFVAGIGCRLAGTTTSILVHAPFSVIIATELLPTWIPPVFGFFLRRRLEPFRSGLPMAPQLRFRNIRDFVLIAGISNAAGSGALLLIPAFVAVSFSPAKIAIFAVAYRVFVSARQMLSWFTLPLLAPTAAILHREPNRISELWERMARQCVAFCVLAYVPLCFIAPEIGDLLLPGLGHAVGQTLVFLVIALVMTGVVAPLWIITAAGGSYRALMAPSLLSFALTAVCVPLSAQANNTDLSAMVVALIAVFTDGVMMLRVQRLAHPFTRESISEVTILLASSIVLGFVGWRVGNIVGSGLLANLTSLIVYLFTIGGVLALAHSYRGWRLLDWIHV